MTGAQRHREATRVVELGRIAPVHAGARVDRHDERKVLLLKEDLQEQAIAYTLKTDYLFWPTRELTLDNALDDWRLISHQH